MSIDEQLLGRSGRNEVSEKSGDFRQSKRQSLIEGKKTLIDGKKTLIEQKEEDVASLRQAALAAKQDQAKQEEKKKKEEAEKITPMRRSTSRLLRQAWFSLITSWGLTLIWINIHVLLRQVFGPKFFCKLGEEWTDDIPAMAGNKIPGAKKTKAIQNVEKMGLGCLDLVLFILILAVLVIIAALLEVVSNPLKILEFVWRWITGQGIISRD